ncbi:MAG TPA: phosphoribosylaminoimidazolecarboxamide formyltransferase [Anaerolineales bacterium]|nr:phosphoribosylaminoimidazolecarboxamide formyltransferase [Anaerolineales bacterium]
MTNKLDLRYGMNPHQKPASVSMPNGANLPFTVLNGSPGMINLLDALNGWALVQELSKLTSLPAAASFKHASPSGVGLGIEVPLTLRESYFSADLHLSPVASAYVRARGTDRLSSFGDLIASSHPVDESMAAVIAREVSDGIIAPAYEPDALEILKKKRSGNYLILQMDADYQPQSAECREVFGVRLCQERHQRPISPADFEKVVTNRKEISRLAMRDFLIAWVTLKYTQSNSICFVKDGQTIGVAAGQQSRLHSVRLAADKADQWFLRQHPRTLRLPFQPGLKRPERDNAIDLFLNATEEKPSPELLKKVFTGTPVPLSATERSEWLNGQVGVTLGSDAFFPFRDSLDRAARSGVSHVLQPGGSARDEEVISAANEYGMLMVFTGIRLFHH